MERYALLTLRRNLAEFISVDPVNISLVRTPQVFNPSTGSWTKGSPVTLNPQQFRLVPFKRRLSDTTQNTQDGALNVADYTIVGRYNVDVEKGDEFAHNGLNYRVIDLEPKSDDRSQTDRVVAALEIRG